MYDLDASYTLSVCERIAAELLAMAHDTPGKPVTHWLTHGTWIEFVSYPDRHENRVRLSRLDAYPLGEMGLWKRASAGEKRTQPLDDQMHTDVQGRTHFAVRFMWSDATTQEPLLPEPRRSPRPRKSSLQNERIKETI